MATRLALITGGMGGLGETITKKMHDAGYKVAVTHSPSNTKSEAWLGEMKSQGYEVREATSAEEAFEILKTERPHLIVMDIQLPGMDGLEATRKLKENPPTRDIPVVAVTSYAMKGDREGAAAAGCVDDEAFVVRPLCGLAASVSR